MIDRETAFYYAKCVLLDILLLVATPFIVQALDSRDLFEAFLERPLTVLYIIFLVYLIIAFVYSLFRGLLFIQNFGLNQVNAY